MSTSSTHAHPIGSHAPRAPRTPRRRLALAALAIAIASRVLVLAVAFRSAATAPPRPASGTTWERGGPVGALLRWDAGYYLEIAERGYSQAPHGEGATTLAFFPVYPLLVRGLSALLAPAGVDLALAAVLLSNVAFLVAIPTAAVAAAEASAAARAARAAGPARGATPAPSSSASDERAGLLTAALLACSPGAAFASFPYTEGLFVLQVCVALLLLGRGRILGASMVSAIATGTRVTGLAVAVAVTIAAWRARRERPVVAIAAPLLSVLGLAAFAGFLAMRFGSPTAFVSAAAAPAWDRSPAHALVEIVRAPARSVIHFLKAEDTVLDLDPWVLACAIVLLALGARRLPATWTALAGVGILIPIISGSYISIVRYIFPLMPLTASLAFRLERIPRPVRIAVVLLFAAGLAGITWLYARWSWAG